MDDAVNGFFWERGGQGKRAWGGNGGGGGVERKEGKGVG
jgi:hypothetical protein